jgi:23S rRNA (uracil1939-C5)-methyltransferase
MHEVRIDGLGTAGDGVARLPSGEVVFVAGGLPGDRVQIRLTGRIKRVQRGEVVRLIEPSAERIVSRCESEDCGGCAVRWLSRPAQAAAKRERAVQALRRIGGCDIDALLGPVVQVGDGWRYRHRVRLHADRFDARWRLGYHARGSHRLAPLETCPVLCPELESAAFALTRALAPLPPNAELREVEMIVSRRDRRAAARITAAGPMQAVSGSLDGLAESTLAGIEVVGGDGLQRHGDLTLRYDHARADEFDLWAEPGVFTQANPTVNDLLVEAVLAALPLGGASVLELHAGVGNLSLPLALAGAELYTAEHMQRAVELAQRNARQAGVRLHAFYVEDVGALLPGGPVPPLATFDAVLMNPPRVGAFEVAKLLAGGGPGRLAYVSCDPATLARDAQVLVDGGYRIRAATAFDMFPQTPHVEVLLSMDRA